jgi:serine/threonine protein kinase/WD40 repeat protein
MSHAESDVDPLIDLAQEFADRYRRGEHPSLSEYVARYPEHADRIRDIFPAMIAIEKHGSSGAWASGERPGRSSSGPALERLGEYRIIREIARGGMGVVYEAVQESLGRHVALKVLPSHRLLRKSQAERFRLEARAAARLHHSNIVPVFGVGESEGVHYYAMQYIHGQSLDVVLDELRGLRGRPPAPDPPSTRRHSELSLTIARALIAGIPITELDAGGQIISAKPGAKGTVDPPEPPGLAAYEHNQPGSNSDLAIQSDFQYVRSVAQIGIQVAEALAYAHQQGILHRDVKPANILLDTQQTAWLTDFGLAKADDSGELTKDGDVVGTMRYMAPERFRGKADRRSDVYGLGLTLYEMLALRPAFAAVDRARLIEVVLHDEPPRPRTIDARVPRDLETIVLKAMAKDPADRYESASALALDLRRFLSDRPIEARQTPAWERLWRFCRRNPALAASIAAMVSLLGLLAIGSAAWSARLDVELRRTSVARHAEQSAKKDALDKLWRSHLARAQAGRFSRRPGQRLDSLDALREAVTLARGVGAPQSSIRELRDEAIACLALPDLRPGRAFGSFRTVGPSYVFDGAFGKYARFDGDRIALFHLEDDEPIVRIADLARSATRSKLSPDGRFLGVALDDRVEVRSADNGGLVSTHSGKALRIEFSADSSRFAIGYADGRLALHDMANGRVFGLLQLGFGPTEFALHPNGNELAVADRERNSGVTLYRLDPVRKLTTFKVGEDGPAVALSYSPDGRRLALGMTNAPFAAIWDIGQRRSLVTLDGHAQLVYETAFSPDGSLVVTQSWDGTCRVWNSQTGRQVVYWPSFIADLHFNPEGDRCGYVGLDGTAKLLEVALGHEYRTLVASVGAGRGEYYRADISGDDLLAVAMDDGVRIWNLRSGTELALVRTGRTASVQFIRGKTGRELLTCGVTGLQRWPIEEDTRMPQLVHIGSPRTVKLPAPPSVASVSASGRTAIVASETSGVGMIVDLDSETLQCPELTHPSLGAGALSPDGRWAATSGWHTRNIKFWDARTGKLAKDLQVGYQNSAFFAPDGNMVVTCVGSEYLFRRVPSWDPVGTLSWEVSSYPGWVAFSPDDRLIALERSPAVVHLVDAKTGATVAKLPDPSSDRARWLGFTSDARRLVTISTYSQAIHVWDLGLIDHGLGALGLAEGFTSLSPLDTPEQKANAREVIVDTAPSVEVARDRQARAEIARHRRALAANPSDAFACNSLAWALATAPAHLRDPSDAVAFAKKAVALQPGNALYRNTLGVAYYRAGRYREALQILLADLESQDDRFLPWDLYFLAMSFHNLGEHDRAADYRNWALRWSRDQKRLTAEDLHELEAVREEMESTLKSPERSPARPGADAAASPGLP